MSDSIGMVQYTTFMKCCPFCTPTFDPSSFVGPKGAEWDALKATDEWKRLKADAEKIATAHAGSGRICDAWETGKMGKALEEEWLPVANAALAPFGLRCVILAKCGIDPQTKGRRWADDTASELLAIRFYKTATAPVPAVMEPNGAATTAPRVIAAVVSPSDAPVAAATAVVATAMAATTISIPFPAGGFQNRPAEADIFQTHQRPFKIDSQFGPGGKTYVVIWTHKSAYDAGLREGMQVVSIYGKPIKNTLTINDLLFSFVKSDGKKGPLVVEVMGAATETAVA